jgi:hypothetical protein
MGIGEIEELEKIANEAINISLERTSVEKLMYIMDVIMVNYDYNNTINLESYNQFYLRVQSALNFW